MIKKLFPKSDFSKNVLTLLTGTSIAQAIPIAISPVLTRIYTPNDFGIYALYMSLASILSVISTGRYELSLLLPKKDEDAFSLLSLSLFLSFLFSIFISIIFYFFNVQIVLILGNPNIERWLYFIPISIFFTGLFQTLTYWSNRNKQYKTIAKGRVSQSSGTAISNLILSLNNSNGKGLIIGGIIGRITGSLYILFSTWKKDKPKIKSVKYFKILALAKRYIIFPKYNTSHAVLNIFSSKSPIFILSSYFTSSSVGLYSLAERIIMLPSGLLASGISQPFYKKMADYKNEGKNIFPLLKKTCNTLVAISVGPFLFLFILGPTIFGFVFGEDWKTAGTIIQILVPFFLLRFIGSVISNIVYVFNEQKKALNIEIVHTFLRVLALLIGCLYNNFYIALILFSIVSTIISAYRLYWYLEIAKNSSTNE
jgi:O-antigen/teichoic acid export membrane protein